MPKAYRYFLIDLKELSLRERSRSTEIAQGVEEYFDSKYGSRFCDASQGWKTFALITTGQRVVKMSAEPRSREQDAYLRLVRSRTAPTHLTRWRLPMQSATRAVALELGLYGSRAIGMGEPTSGDKRLLTMDETATDAAIRRLGPRRIQWLSENPIGSAELDERAVAEAQETLRLYEGCDYAPFSYEVDEPHVYPAYDLRAENGPPRAGNAILVVDINFMPPGWPLPPRWVEE